MTEKRFSGRRVVVTGGASGIGEACAALLHEQGARVYLFDVAAERVAESASRLGDGVSAHPCDVTREPDCQAAFDAIASEGAVDGLVCCAGRPDIPARAEDIDMDAWNAVVESHLNGTLVPCRIAGRAMLSGGGGAIVNVASVLAFNSGPVLAYGAAKAAIVNVTASLATQWASRGVRVNAVAPGWTDTPFLRPKARGGERDLSPILAASPLRRLLDPREIAEVVAFLLSPLSSAIVGTTVAADGGVLAAAGWPPYGGVPGAAA